MSPTQSLYDQVRNCIREGYTVNETATLCDCNKASVYRYTADLRTNRRHTPAEVQERMVADWASGKSTAEIAAQYNMDPQNVSQILRRRTKDKPKAVPKAAEASDTKEAVEVLDVEVPSVREGAAPAQSGSVFNDFLITLDGASCRYMIHSSGSVRISSAGMASPITINLSDVGRIAAELTEIARRFDGMTGGER